MLKIQRFWAYILDFKDVKGQDELIEAVVLAAAGGHNMLMVGEPGCGKTMIAQRIPTILPEMTEEECLEVTKIYRNIGVRPHEIHIKKIKQNQKFYKRNIKYLVKAYHK